MKTKSANKDMSSADQAVLKMVADGVAPEWSGCVEPKCEFRHNDLVLYRVEEITYEEDSPRLEALENAFSCMTVAGVNLVYLIMGDANGVQFYFGFMRDLFAPAEERATDFIRELADEFLRPALEGNFRGSVVKRVEDAGSIRTRILDWLKDKDTCEVMSGVPGLVKDQEKQDFRGVDRLVDVMQGESFGFMVLAKPLSGERLDEIRDAVYSTYELFSAHAKQSTQTGVNGGRNSGESKSGGSAVSEGESITTGTSRSENVMNGRSSGESSGGSYSSTNHGTSTSKTIGGGSSETKGTNTQTTKNDGWSKQTGRQEGYSLQIGREIVNKKCADWVKYFDEVLIPRLDYGTGKGLFAVTTVMLGAKPQIVHKLSNAARSIFAGETANRIPLATHRPGPNERKFLSSFQIAYCKPGPEALKTLMPYGEALFANCHGLVSEKGDGTADVVFAGSWMSGRELAMVAGLPQKEVVGMRLKEEVEFGLNPELGRPIEKEDRLINMGQLVKSGTVCGRSVSLFEKDLDRHVFVAGVTGCGKTTTCQHLLLATQWPFLVIEPAKTEYRVLKFAGRDSDGKSRAPYCKDLLVFTLGDDTVAPFRLNPFELIPEENIASRVDMLMASITAAFDMEAAIPQLIERAIYECYKDYGWDVNTNKNRFFADPFADGVFSFPTLGDVLAKVQLVVENQHFDARLKQDYIGSINARLQGLMTGAKGFMLNCRRSIDFVGLLDKKVVLEIEQVSNRAQKGLIMGFVLTNLLQAIRYKFQKNGGRKIRHMTLIEEAHNLLARPEPGTGQSQRQAAQTFADMLAEIRKYGESLVIADQVPGALIPEVMKNTNTKIIHRLFAQDDQEAIGRTMGLRDEQVNYLSSLPVGHAIVFNGSWPKAVHCAMPKTTDTSGAILKDEKVLIRKTALDYYRDDWRRGALEFWGMCAQRPTDDDVAFLLENHQHLVENLVCLFETKANASKDKLLWLMAFVNRYGVSAVARVVMSRYMSIGLKSPLEASQRKLEAVFLAIQKSAVVPDDKYMEIQNGVYSRLTMPS